MADLGIGTLKLRVFERILLGMLDATLREILTLIQRFRLVFGFLLNRLSLKILTNLVILILLKVIVPRGNQILLLLLRVHRLLLGLLRGSILDAIRRIVVLLTLKLLEVFTQGKKETSLVWVRALKDHPVPFVFRRESSCNLDGKVL